MIGATHFIEQIKHPGFNHYVICNPFPIRLLEWSRKANERLNIQTIAIFKIKLK